MPDEIEVGDLSFEQNGETPPAPEQEPEPYSSQFFNGQEFISTVPEADRPIVQKYLSPVMQQWDGGLNEKFQTSAAKIKQYEELGELEKIQRATSFYDGWNADPENTVRSILGAIAEYSGSAEAFAQQMYALTGIPQSPQGEQQVTNLDQGFNMEEEEDPRDQLFEQLAQNQQELNERMEAWQTEQEDARDNAALDNEMNRLHNQYGQFDDSYVLLQIANGVPSDQAVQAFQSLGQTYFGGNSQPPPRTPPKVMGGQGGIPSGQVDPSKLKPQDRRALVQQFLDAQAQ